MIGSAHQHGSHSCSPRSSYSAQLIAKKQTVFEDLVSANPYRWPCFWTSSNTIAVIVHAGKVAFCLCLPLKQSHTSGIIRGSLIITGLAFMYGVHDMAGYRRLSRKVIGQKPSHPYWLWKNLAIWHHPASRVWLYEANAWHRCSSQDTSIVCGNRCEAGKCLERSSSCGAFSIVFHLPAVSSEVSLLINLRTSLLKPPSASRLAAMSWPR